MSIYLGASFVVSLYSHDVNSFHAATAIGKTADPLIISSLCELEVINAFELHVFRKRVTENEALRSRPNLEKDLLDGVLRRVPVVEEIFLRARFDGRTLLAKHTRLTRLLAG